MADLSDGTKSGRFKPLAPILEPFLEYGRGVRFGRGHSIGYTNKIGRGRFRRTCQVPACLRGHDSHNRKDPAREGRGVTLGLWYAGYRRNDYRSNFL